ncbi:MAG: hypothetical protein KF757_09495 [Phycisphaeraceae bacterium]|nr:hypothetical protein [Phycisphaeraceae bacterium]MCW5763442.1 hypothetical protein [Phycisphaeraceae bacterium]
MVILLFFLFMFALGGACYAGVMWFLEHKRVMSLEAEVHEARSAASAAATKAAALLEAAESEARILTTGAQMEADSTVTNAKVEADAMTAAARTKAKEQLAEAQMALSAAAMRSEQIIADAEKHAERIAGKAYEAVRDADRFEQTARAMRNIVEGYGDAYLAPASGLLDELAEEFSHKDAGRHLKMAREHSAAMVAGGACGDL